MSLIQPLVDRVQDAIAQAAMGVTLRWGTVTQADPLRVRLDGDMAEIPFKPATVVQGLSVGDRALCATQHRRVTVLGSLGGATAGVMEMFAGDTPPTGWLLCDGRAVSRSTYSRLFIVVGTKFGVGDGTTTFNLPDMRGRVPVGVNSADTEFNELGKKFGAKTHTLTQAEMPAHQHAQRYSLIAAAGSGVGGMATTGSGAQTQAEQQTMPAGGGGAHNNVQPSLALHYIIRT